MEFPGWKQRAFEIDPEKVLQEADVLTIEQQINGYAYELALLGDIESARDLVSVQFNAPPLNNWKWVLMGLSFAWKETGKLPDGLSQTEQEDCLKSARKNYEEAWPSVPEEKRTFDEAGLEALLALEEDRDVKDIRVSAPYYRNPRLVKALDISLRLSGGSNISSSRGAADASNDALLAAFDLDLRTTELVNTIAAHLNIGQMKQCLSLAEHLWPYYARGIFAAAFGLTQDEVRAKGKMMVETFQRRIRSQPRPFTSKSILELLQIADENTRKNTSLEYWEHEVVPDSLLHPPATDAEIEDLESRCGIALPEDYKAFLRITNGFGAGGEGIFNGVFPDPRLHSVQEAEWLDDPIVDLPVQLLQLPKEIECLVEITNDECDTPLPTVEWFLNLGQRDVDSIWLIPPEKVQETVEVYRNIYEAADSEQKRVVDRAVEVFASSWEAFGALEWCCLSADLGTPGMDWFPSFRQYLERSAWSSREIFILKGAEA